MRSIACDEFATQCKCSACSSSQPVMQPGECRRGPAAPAKKLGPTTQPAPPARRAMADRARPPRATCLAAVAAVLVLVSVRAQGKKLPPCLGAVGERGARVCVHAQSGGACPANVGHGAGWQHAHVVSNGRCVPQRN